MAAATRLLDVWIVEMNTVYREVPFTVVTDWLQQGRLLAEDRVRLAGGKTWHPIQKVPALTPFLPQPEPLGVEDQAEALEPVDLDFTFATKSEAEDEDVDMIPLIDISLVLLIFFMMTASVSAGFFALINTPSAKHKLDTIALNSYWVGIEPKSRAGTIEKGPDGQPLPWFSLGRDQQELLKPSTDSAAMLNEFAGLLAKTEGEVRIRLRADRDLPIETIKGITLDLQNLEARLNHERKEKLAFAIAGEVSAPE